MSMLSAQQYPQDWRTTEAGSHRLNGIAAIERMGNREATI
jgi:hypothetical protein